MQFLANFIYVLTTGTMRYLIILALAGFLALPAISQDNNPLLNSAELIQKGNELHDQGKYSEAITLYKKVTRGDTNYFRALYEMAFSQMVDSQFTAARAACEKGLSEPNDDWPEFYTLYGSLIDDLGDPLRALRIYDSALALFPAYTELHLNKGTTLLIQKKYAEAEAVFQQGLLINPYQASCHYKLAYAAYQQGKIVPAMLGYIYYLLLQPSGRYQSNAINALSAIGKASDEVRDLIDKRTADSDEGFSMIEKILLSKIALDKNYKPLLKLDDPISRQIQVLFEKLEYDEQDGDFYMQFYVPFYRSIFADGKFEPFINRLFANVKVEVIQDYVKKKEKALKEIVDLAVNYCDGIRTSRELNFEKRAGTKIRYQFDNGKLFGRGETNPGNDTLLGAWEFYYSAGNLRSKGNYDANGEKDGPWKYYHFNGRLRGQQHFKHGKLEGEEIFYFDNGKMSSFSTYKNDLETGESRTYFRVGIPRSVSQYKDGKRDGERRAYSGYGYLTAIEHYKLDSLDGPFSTYYPSGLMESKGFYSNGELEGAYTAYHENGKISQEGQYKNGKLQGEFKHYHPNGKLKSTQIFANGEAEGAYSEYYNNGQLFYKTVYHGGKINGEVEYFDRDGKRFFIYTYDNSLTKAVRYFDKTGKQISLSERKKKTLDLVTYYSDGYKRSEASYNEDDNMEGTERYYFRSGKISQENTYVNGTLEGLSTGYHENGKKQVEIAYQDGERHGYKKYWYDHGQLEEEGWFQEGNMQGTWYTYDEMGNLQYRTEYLNNDLNGERIEYFPNGKVDKLIRYNLGWLEEMTQFDSTGREFNHLFIRDGEGKYIEKFFNGRTYAEGSYVNGELNGPFTYYYPDGKINTVQYYRYGKLDSTYRNYLHSGQISQEGQYRAGDRVGTWKRYYENGQLYLVENYDNGELEGKSLQYHENGKPETEREFDEGDRTGWSKYFDEDGNLVYQTRYELGLPKAYTYFDKAGKLLPEIPIPGGSGKVKPVFPNGKTAAEFEYVDGKLIGDNLTYHPNGKLQFSSREDYSLTEGKLSNFYASGQLQSEYTYLHNSLHGPYHEYNGKGVLTEEGNYYNGLLHGVMKMYDDTGKLKETRRYYYGILQEIK